MNGLINLPKLGDVGSFCILEVVAYSMSSLVYVLASGFFGCGAAFYASAMKAGLPE